MTDTAALALTATAALAVTGTTALAATGTAALAVRVGRITPNRAAAPRDSRFGQNERLCDSAIRRFGNSQDQRVST